MKLGIIGGSGLDDPKLLKDPEELEVNTPYGKPSSPITHGLIGGVDVYLLARHGRKHELPPTKVNNRANIQALKSLGCTHVIATTAVGSLRERIGRGDFVVLSDFIDFTRHRNVTFFDDFKNGPKHTSLADPFSEFLRKKVINSCKDLKLDFHPKGTVITIEGPRFSTRAESNVFRLWGADVINMSVAPEAVLAREAGLEYAAIAMSTDYDCWKTDELPVSWDEILKIFKSNADKMKQLLVNVIESLNLSDEEFIKSKIRTIPNWPKQGIMFHDITTLLRDAQGFNRVMKLLEERYKDKDIDFIAGVESRGFILASALASKLNKGVILIRKKGKLPAETISGSYDLEYGSATLEVHKDAVKPGQKVLLLDDLVATGGTIKAAGNLIERLGGQVVECGFIVDLPDLKGSEGLKWPVYKMVDFEGE